MTNPGDEEKASEILAGALGSGIDPSDIKYHDLLEGVGAAIFAIDTDGRFVFVNSLALELLGYEAEELAGKHFTTILGEEQAQVAQELIQRGKEIRPLVIEAKRKDGGAVSVEVSGAWVRRRGRRVGALAMAWALSGSRQPGSPTAQDLSKLDMTILQLLSSGLSNREIAERVYLSAHTVRDRVEKLMRRFGVSRRTELAATAARQGLV